MSFSAFDIIGPSMIGPSSSHTAGAVRLGLIARALAGGVFDQAACELHGSFAATGSGHATDRGLVAGLLGFAPDDERLKDALNLAATAGLAVTFSTVDLGESAHPNTARIRLKGPGGVQLSLTGSSVGGGSVRVSEVDEFSTSFSGELDTLALWHRDMPGLLAKVTALLACVEANIATIHTARKTRGDEALTLIEVDGMPPPEVIAVLRRIATVERVAQVARLF